MKYENPTCEIVLLDDADCLRTSVEWKVGETPFVVH